MSFSELFNLRTNPFRMTPAVSPDEIFWAGFPDVKSVFEKTLKRSIKIPNSSLILNWGEYGSGKTHAARYFGKQNVLAELANEVNAKPPYFIFVTLPKGKNPIHDFYISIIDKIDIQALRDRVGKHTGDVNSYITATQENNHLRSVLMAIFNPAVEENIIKRYLYQTNNNTENKPLIEFGILRPLNSDSDFTKIISGLFSCITFDKRIFSSIVLWIDEFEDIAVMTKVNGDKTNSFLRELLDNTPNNLLVFLNLTQSALFSIEDLGEYISEALRSRIRQRIQFNIPTADDILKYVSELLLFYRVDRVNPDREGYFPYDEPVLRQISTDLKNKSIRGINEALGLLLDLAELEDTSPVQTEFYTNNKSDIVTNWRQ